MAGQVYSVRFFLARGTTTYTRYTVPAGKRAVIRNLLARASFDAGDYFSLTLGQYSIWQWTAPGSNSTQAFETRVVVRAGEYFEVYTSGRDLIVVVSGYLFDDPASLTKPTNDDVSRRLGPPPEGSGAPEPKVSVLAS